MTRTGGFAPALAGAALLLTGWICLAAWLGGSLLVAGPGDVTRWIGSHPGLVARALAETARNGALGFIIGNLTAICLASMAALWPRLLGTISAFALVLFCLPLIATAPILRALMGPGNGPQIALAALAVYYTTLIPLLTGLRATPASWLDLVASYGRGRVTELAYIRARAALPYLFAGLQIAAPAALLAAMVGEFTGAERGLGVLTIRYMRALDIPALWGVALISAAAASLAYAGIGLVARHVLRDSPPVLLSPPRGGSRLFPARLAEAAALSVLVLFGWWAGLWLLDLNPFFARSPAQVLDALSTAPDAAATRATLAQALGETAIYLLPGYLAGLLLGAALAVLLTLSPALAALIMPLAIALRSIPIVTTAPLIVLALGRGALGTISLVAIMVFFPTLVACLHGLRRAPGQVLDLFESYAAGRLRQMIHVRIPAMLPALFAAARMSVPAAVLAVTVVEWLTTGRGLGSLMALSASLSDYDMLWSAMVIVTVISVLSYQLVAMLERRVLSVYAPEQMRR